MKKNNNTQKHNTPDSDFIDLDALDNLNNANSTEDVEDIEDIEDTKASKKGISRFFNVHVIFLCLLLVIGGFMVYRIKNWGVQVDLDEIFKDGPGTYEDSFDTVLPLLDEDLNIIMHEEPATILMFGNSPLADDRDSEDGLANMIADMTGATVYNASIGDSYLACEDVDMDMFTLYWLVHLACGSDVSHKYIEGQEILGDAYPEDAHEAIEILSSIDMNEVDIVTIMYDATDYLMGHGMFDDANVTNIYTFTGNLEASIELLQTTYPHIRIIVMSPTYAYAVDTEGNYVSSDQYRYNDQDVLSTYVIKQYASCYTRSVSFVDHLYNTINEDNASQYLTDNLHLNLEGRKLVAERFEYFLNYYNKGYGAN